MAGKATAACMLDGSRFAGKMGEVGLSSMFGRQVPTDRWGGPASKDRERSLRSLREAWAHAVGNADDEIKELERESGRRGRSAAGT